MKKIWIYTVILLVPFLVGCTLPAPTRSGGATATQISETQPSITLAPLSSLPTDTPEPENTATLESTETEAAAPQISASPTLLPSETPAPVSEQKSETPFFVVQNGSPVATLNFVYPDKGCNWMGVGGQVFGMDSAPLEGYIVQVGGTLDGKDSLGLALTGGTTPLGPGGYTVKVSDQPIASQTTLWVQLFDVSGKPQSNKLYFDTYSDCERNLILINFVQVSSPPVTTYYYFPIVPEN